MLKKTKLLLILSLVSQPIFADQYPNKPIHLIIPYAAGGPTDVFGRAFAHTLSQQLSQPVVVENKTGAGTLVGTQYVAKAKPDGYTLLLTTVAHAVNPSLHNPLPYKNEDLTAVGLVAKAPLVLVANLDFPPSTAEEFINHLEKNPNKTSYASAGIGSAPHIAMELLRHNTNLQSLHIPYRGSAPAMADVIGGHADFMIDSAPTGLAQVKAGSVKLIATTMQDRLALTPDTQSLGEVVPNYEAYTWNGVFIPANTPVEISLHIETAINQTLTDPQLQKTALELGLILESSTSGEALNTFYASELEKWSTVMADHKK